MAVKTITVTDDACAALAALKREGEGFSDAIRRLARRSRPLLDFAGAWKDAPEKKMQQYLAFLKAGDELSKAKISRETRRAGT